MAMLKVKFTMDDKNVYFCNNSDLRREPQDAPEVEYVNSGLNVGWLRKDDKNWVLMIIPESNKIYRIPVDIFNDVRGVGKVSPTNMTGVIEIEFPEKIMWDLMNNADLKYKKNEADQLTRLGERVMQNQKKEMSYEEIEEFESSDEGIPSVVQEIAMNNLKCRLTNAGIVVLKDIINAVRNEQGKFDVPDATYSKHIYRRRSDFLENLKEEYFVATVYGGTRVGILDMKAFEAMERIIALFPKDGSSNNSNPFESAISKMSGEADE